MRRVSALALVAAVGVLSLTGCDVLGPGKKSRGVGPARPPVAAPGGTESASAQPRAGGNGSVAKAGDTFRLGQVASLPYRSGSKEGTVRVTVRAIQRGAVSDLRSLRIRSRTPGVPYYIRAIVKNAGDTDLSFTSPRSMQGVLADGSPARSLLIIGSFPKCDSESFPSDSTKGRAFRTCFVALAPRGTAVTAARWVNTPFDGIDNYVTWRS